MVGKGFFYAIFPVSGHSDLFHERSHVSHLLVPRTPCFSAVRRAKCWHTGLCFYCPSSFLCVQYTNAAAANRCDWYWTTSANACIQRQRPPSEIKGSLRSRTKVLCVATASTEHRALPVPYAAAGVRSQGILFEIHRATYHMTYLHTLSKPVNSCGEHTQHWFRA